MRLKQFCDARQKEGQSAIEFMEELLSLIEEADGINIGVNELSESGVRASANAHSRSYMSMHADPS